MKKNLLCVATLFFSLVLSSCSGTTQNEQINASEVTTLLEQYSSSLTTLKIERKGNHQADTKFHLNDKVVSEKTE